MEITTDNEFKNRLLKEDLYYKNSEKYAEKIRDISSIVIWGSSNGGQLVYDFLNKFDANKNVKYYADNAKKKWGTTKNGLLILSPDEVLELVKKDSNTRLIIASEYLAEIRKQLISLGINNGIIDIKGFEVAKDYLAYQSKTPYHIIHSNFNKYEEAYSHLSDERSKEIYMRLLNCKISLDNSYLEGITDPAENQYFDKDLIHFNDNEIFCDCGSFNGDTLETYIRLSAGRYSKYIAIEADKDIYTQLNKKVAENKYRNVQTHNIACWNKKTILKFQSAQSAGHITETGEISVNADELDNIVKDENVTFIKMDIEGAEVMALKGACRVIRECKPVLAICIYHDLDHFYKIPLLMKEYNKDYKLYIRHYTDMFDHETVCYAIPKMR